MYLPAKKKQQRLYFNLFKTLPPSIPAFKFFSVFIFLFSFQQLIAQNIDKTVTNLSNEKVVIAGKQYGRNSFHQWLWGKHYRKEWTTPVIVKMLNLDTARGGLIPYEIGGGRQSKSLRLKNSREKEYVLRTIDKTFGKALPDIYRGTFIEDIVNDQVSFGHPYSAVTISPMAEAGGIFHTNPEIVFIPEQVQLGAFKTEFGNQLYLLEERPDENWEEAAFFGNSKKIIGTENLLEKIHKDNDNRIDQLLYVRSRLFDILIGDWGRHEDQWRWATVTDGKKTIYKPIPRDRDQAYTKFDGVLLHLGISIAGLDHLQSFDETIRNVPGFNFPARNLDRVAANEPTLEQWTTIAKEVQKSLTNKVIESSIMQLPPEIFAISGAEIISKLKSRRNHLVEYATIYYKFLAKEVEVVGTNDKELFEVTRLNDNETSLKVFKISNSGDLKKEPFYHRVFLRNETNEIRLYGLEDNDVFSVKGETGKGIRVRIIGGEGIDTLNDLSSVAGRKKLTLFYDTEKSQVHSSRETKLRIQNDTALNKYKYDAFAYHKKGFSIMPGPVYIKAGYSFRNHQWGKQPFGTEQSIFAKYIITRGALNIEYKGLFNQAIGKWNIGLRAGANVPEVVNFFGIGNETSRLPKNTKYHRLRSEELYTIIGINRSKPTKYFIELNTFYQSVKIRDDGDRIIRKFTDDSASIDLSRKHFAGVSGIFNYMNTNDAIIPTGGFVFHTAASYTYNLSNIDHSFTKLASDAAVYIPILKFLSLAVRVGGATNIGEAEFFQLNYLGSHYNLRGYKRQRFHAKSSFYNNNELRILWNTKNKIFNGKMGAFGFYDNGRVWQPGEISNTWHKGYGGGIFLAPFNKILVSGSYGISKEDKVISVNLGFFF